MTENNDDLNLLSDYEADFEESISEELQDLFAEDFHTPSTRPISLADKLEALENFPVSPASSYLDPTWSLPVSSMRPPINLAFNSDMPGFADLNRALTGYALPQFNPFNTVKSYNTTKLYHYNAKLIERLILAPNHITAIPEHLALISTKMLNEALDAAKASDSPANYAQLYRMLCFWAALSEQNLIPTELKLPITLDSFAYKERHMDVQDHYLSILTPWKAFSELELESLLTYSLFWTEKAIPALDNIKYQIAKLKWGKNQNINRQNPDPIIEAIKTSIDGIDIFRINKTELTKDRRPRVYPTYTKKATRYTIYSYTWLTNYGVALDKIRNAIFILMALLTGARISELNPMRFSDIWKAENGEYWVKIRRWKTSTDPNYHGDLVEIPIPSFLGEIVSKFKDLRDFKVQRSIPRKDYLFGSNLSNRVSNHQAHHVSYIISTLKDELQLDKLHCHRFRKTIAEILINRDERNIEIIRYLFGHDSYEMTLKYIARNPFMVRDIAIAFENSYSEDLYTIIREVCQGHYSGEAANRIATSVTKDGGAFLGKALKLTVLRYVSHLLMAGEPIFIQRTAVGTFCVNGENFTEENAPPCARNDKGQVISDMPVPSNCHYECRNIVVLPKAKQAIMENIKFCQHILKSSGAELSASGHRLVAAKLATFEQHLQNLSMPNPQVDLIVGGGE